MMQKPEGPTEGTDAAPVKTRLGETVRNVFIIAAMIVAVLLWTWFNY